MSEKILIVDDDLDSLKLIGLMLQRHGYEVIAANAGAQALAKAVSERPNLIILDIMMPDMDGYEVCRRLRAHQTTRAIPIIMFTAKTLVDDKVAGFEAGADDYLTKPTHPAELASRVKAMLMRSAGQQRSDSPRGTTIGLIGAKGGVGTTTLALNIAAAALMSGDTPVLADFRLGVGSLGLMLGLDGTPGIANLLSRPAAEIQPATVQRELVSHASNLRALLSSAYPQEAQGKYSVESAVAVVNSLRSIGHPVVVDLGCGYNTLVSRLQLEMDQILLVVDSSHVSLAMAHELLRELENTSAGAARVHTVMVNRSSFNVPWSEVEQVLGRELRAIISDAPELVHQAARAATPLVMLQPGAIVSNQIVKLTEELNTRIRTVSGSQMMT